MNELKTNASDSATSAADSAAAAKNSETAVFLIFFNNIF